MGGMAGGRETQEGGAICMHIADSLPSTAETNIIVKQLYPNRLKKNHKTRDKRGKPSVGIWGKAKKMPPLLCLRFDGVA